MWTSQETSQNLSLLSDQRNCFCRFDRINKSCNLKIKAVKNLELADLSSQGIKSVGLNKSPSDDFCNMKFRQGGNFRGERFVQFKS